MANSLRPSADRAAVGKVGAKPLNEGDYRRWMIDGVVAGTVWDDLNRVCEVAVGQNKIERPGPLIDTTLTGVDPLGRAAPHANQRAGPSYVDDRNTIDVGVDSQRRGRG